MTLIRSDLGLVIWTKADTETTAVLYGNAGDEEEGLRFLDKVFEMGCTFWDTAEVGIRFCFCCVGEEGTKKEGGIWRDEC